MLRRASSSGAYHESDKTLWKALRDASKSLEPAILAQEEILLNLVLGFFRCFFGKVAQLKRKDRYAGNTKKNVLPHPGSLSAHIFTTMIGDDLFGNRQP